MQKIVIDTNVLVSALIQPSYPYLIIYHLFAADKILMCVSSALLREYYDVLSFPKFAGFPDFFLKVESLLAEIHAKAKEFSPVIRIDLISDKNDNKLLELAETCNADFFITGNTHDFTFPHYKHTKFLTLRDNWENYRPD